MESREGQSTLHPLTPWGPGAASHPPEQPGLSDMFTVKEMILICRAYQKCEGSSVASGLSNRPNELDNEALLVQGDAFRIV